MFMYINYINMLLRKIDIEHSDIITDLNEKDSVCVHSSCFKMLFECYKQFSKKIPFEGQCMKF